MQKKEKKHLRGFILALLSHHAGRKSREAIDKSSTRYHPMKHSWKYSAQGVAPYSGRPHGIDEVWTCRKCGCQKARGPQSTHTGKRVIRWSYNDASGYPADGLPGCR